MRPESPPLRRRDLLTRLHRIGSALHPLFDGTGAMSSGGRWNGAGFRAIYGAPSLDGSSSPTSGAPLRRPQVLIEIDVPDDVAITILEARDLPAGWDHATAKDVAQAIGDAWFTRRTAAVLRVPSVAAAESHVYVINQDHPDFARMTAGSPRPLVWDTRLFGR